MNLEQYFKENKKIAVACSGGVDSVYLLCQAVKYGAEVKAYFVKSNFQPEFELEDAAMYCNEIGAPLKIINIDVLSDEEVISNPSNRCYFCKKAIFKTIINEAKKDGFEVLIEGTNASDDISDRPGVKALKELGVESPLRLCGMEKKDIRAGAKEDGLAVYKKPSYACLATRIPTGTKITKELLDKVERAEGKLFSMGFEDFRVRIDSKGGAKIQVASHQLPFLIENRTEIVTDIGQYFDDVVLDLKVMR